MASYIHTVRSGLDALRFPCGSPRGTGQGRKRGGRGREWGGGGGGRASGLMES